MNESICIIELADSSINVARAGEIILRSPGYALIQEKQIRLGEEALSQARLHPRHSHNQFWHRLSLDPISHPTPLYRHHADLVHAHLNQIATEIGPEMQVVFAVPGSYSREQLALLLGVAQESRLKTVGLVDLSVAVASTLPLSQPSYYLDIFLHEAMINRLEVGERVKRGAVTPVKGCGLVKLHDQWLKLAADQFVEQCRFDPLHSASSEQALYQQLPAWLAAARQGQDAQLVISSNSGQFQAQLSPEQVLARAKGLYQQLADTLHETGWVKGQSVLLSERLACLPGIQAFFPGAQAIAELAFYQGCATHLDAICRPGESLSFVTALPRAASTAAEVPEPEMQRERPTHVLWGPRAYVLEQPLWIGCDGDGQVQVSRQSGQLAKIYACLQAQAAAVRLQLLDPEIPFTLKGQPLQDGALLQLGDELLLGSPGQTLMLIGEA